MNRISRRLLAGILAFSMVWSLAAPAWAADASTDESSVSALTEETDAELSGLAGLDEASDNGQAVEQENTSSSAPNETDPADSEPSETSSVGSDPADEGGASGSASASEPAEIDPADIDPADTSTAEDGSESALESEAVGAGSLTMEYDDRYTVDDIEENDNLDVDLDGYTIKSVKTGTVSSYQVSEGSVTDSKDTAVIKKTSDTAIKATGVGTAVVTLTDGTDTITYTVTVEPATLTIMFLAGQSNTEGYCSTASGSEGYNNKKVVPCEPGTVYSSYGGLGKDSRTKTRTKQVSGISSPAYLSADGSNAADLIAESLTSTTSVSGESLVYELDKLTSNVTKRKTGMDAGLAYRWNELTGDKVWVVNAAVGGSAIERWSPSDGVWYSRALAFFTQALKVYKAEISAGHYKAGKRLMFWLQGEANASTSTSSYLKQFRNVASAYKSALSLKAVGIIMVRSCVDEDDSGSVDLQMTGPRRAQYGLSSSTKSTDSFIYVVSNANEQWTTDAGVTEYFSTRYPSGKFTYPTGTGTTRYVLPSKYLKVKPDLHYTQLGHNENGVTAAEGMYEVLYKGGGTPESVTWVNYKGTAASGVYVNQGKTAVAVAEVNPVTSAKEVTFEVDGTYCTKYDAATGTVTAGKKSGQGWIKVVYNGETLGTLKVFVVLPTPTLSASANLASGIKIKWTKVSGADSYQIWRKTGSGKWSMIDTVSGGSTVTYTDTSVKNKNGTFYTYTVRATTSANSYLRSSYDSTGLRITRLTAVKLTKASNSSGRKLTAYWGKNANCGGYLLQYSTNSDFSGGKAVTISGSGTLKKTISGLKKGKTYYVRVRCYKKVSGVTSYSAWSNTLKVKIKK